jgi:hypothetical protein
MLSRDENDRLMTIYDSLLQLYVLRDQARRTKNWREQAILDQDIEAVELRWQALREKRKSSFN